MLNYKSKLERVQVPYCVKAQEILDFYKNKGAEATELVRIDYAEELCLEWNKERIPFPLPAVPEKSDFWYLVQLYFTGRHLNNEGKVYKFDLGKSEEIYMENIKEDFSSKIITNSFTPYSRNDLDKMIKLNGDRLIKKLGFDCNLFKLIPIPFDIYLRLSNKLNWGNKSLNVFFDGYRKRTDGIMTSLFGGNMLFGGASFIDSIWKDSIYTSIYPKLIIVRKDYGN